ncbi:MAG: helix-turn-helix transcriptional regulator [Bdellovibrionales bacterium]|nr:helix-turn-helix transcriptional regulator [Bdellovibrionales bacterium]
MPHQKFSKRESEVFFRIIQGRRNLDIAHDLKISEKTVSSYKSRICQKLSASTTADIIRYAYTNHLLNA